MSKIELSDPLPENVLEYPYDATLDVATEFEAAMECATQSGKRVLVNFGANWCPDARILCTVLELPALQSFIHTQFETVMIDVGRYDMNMDMVEHLGFSNGLEGVPTILILDADGRTLNAGEETRWRTARQSTPQDIADYFSKFAPTGAQ
jgi:thiol-disulfide isomerase/thioredoxin